MPLIYITGISGSGKSAIRRELKTRGYEAHDVDEDRFRSWYNRETKTKAKDQKAWPDTTVEWRKLYWLLVDRKKVEALSTKAQSENKIIFLSGTTPNDNEVWDLFDKVMSLSVSDETLKQRLADRTDNNYGKHPDDLEDILSWNRALDTTMTKNGAILIDAEQPLGKVVDEILEKVA
jgi:dephospho-CoA kinase